MAELANKQELHESKVAESEKWIQKAVNPAHKGGLHKALHVAQDKTIPKAKIEKATHSKNPKLRHMAQFAKNVAMEGTCSSCGCSPCECVEESALQGYLGKKKYGPEGMKALQKAGREHAGQAKMDQIRNRYDKMDEADMEEGNAFSGALVNAKKDHKTEFEVDGKKYKVVEADPMGLEEGHCPTCDCAPCKCNEGAGVMHFKDQKAKEAGKKTFKLGDKTFPVKEKKEPKSKGTAFDPEVAKGMFADKDEHPRHDVKDTGYSKRYTRKHEDDIEKDDEVKSDEPKRKGRPKSAKPKDQENVTKGSYKYKMVNGKRVKKDGVKEDGIPLTDRGEYDNEGSEVKGDMHTVIRHATELERHLRDQENLPTWVIEKIGQIKGMMTSVSDYILSQHERGVEHATGEEGIRIAERSKSQAQAHMMAAAAHNPKFAKKVGMKQSVAKEFNQADKGKDISKLPKKVKKTDEGAKPDFLDVDKDGNKKETFKKAVADKKDKDWTPERKAVAKKKGEWEPKVKEEKVDETTSGSVATATPAGKSNKGGMQFGKGVYESLDRQFKQALTESISVESKMSECGNGEMAPAITITADGEEAAKLMMLLKLAGLESQIPAACPTCGGSPCGCDEMVDENAPDWPTDDQTLSADPELRTYSGGLNGPKSTGQTTVPVVASQLRRQVSMEESVKIEHSLFKNWQQYKG